MNHMKQTFSTLRNNVAGMGLSTTIALGFGGAVVLVAIIGLIVYLVNR